MSASTDRLGTALREALEAAPVETFRAMARAVFSWAEDKPEHAHVRFQATRILTDVAEDIERRGGNR